jgi:hypothetical protein
MQAFNDILPHQFQFVKGHLVKRTMTQFFRSTTLVQTDAMIGGPVRRQLVGVGFAEGLEVLVVFLRNGFESLFPQFLLILREDLKVLYVPIDFVEAGYSQSFLFFENLVESASRNNSDVHVMLVPAGRIPSQLILASRVPLPWIFLGDLTPRVTLSHIGNLSGTRDHAALLIIIQCPQHFVHALMGTSVSFPKESRFSGRPKSGGFRRGRLQCHVREECSQLSYPDFQGQQGGLDISDLLTRSGSRRETRLRGILEIRGIRDLNGVGDLGDMGRADGGRRLLAVSLTFLLVSRHKDFPFIHVPLVSWIVR